MSIPVSAVSAHADTSTILTGPRPPTYASLSGIAAHLAGPHKRRVPKLGKARRKLRDLWRPVAGQTALFDLNAPVQLALFGDDVPVDALVDGAL